MTLQFSWTNNDALSTIFDPEFQASSHVPQSGLQNAETLSTQLSCILSYAIEAMEELKKYLVRNQNQKAIDMLETLKSDILHIGGRAVFELMTALQQLLETKPKDKENIFALLEHLEQSFCTYIHSAKAWQEQHKTQYALSINSCNPEQLTTTQARISSGINNNALDLGLSQLRTALKHQHNNCSDLLDSQASSLRNIMNDDDFQALKAAVGAMAYKRALLLLNQYF